MLAAAQEHGLAPLLGSSPTVGVVGYTLGGGLGWLGRKYGLSADNVVQFELVTADGQRRIASASENSDLFWGLRGGGSLGIVTSLTIRLFPVTQVYAGNLFYPARMAREVFRHYRAWTANAPVDPMPGFNSGAWLRDLSDAALDAVVDYGLGQGGPSPLIFAEIRHAGGTIRRLAPETAVFGNRDAEFVLSLVGVVPFAEAQQRLMAYVGELMAVLRPSLTGGVYMNFLEGVESQQRIRDGLAAGRL